MSSSSFCHESRATHEESGRYDPKLLAINRLLSSIRHI